MELVIEDGLLMVFGPEGDPVPPAAFIELAAEQPEVTLSLADGIGASAARVAAVLEAQTLGRLGAAEHGDRWIQTMLREGEGPEQASDATIETELTDTWPEPSEEDGISVCEERQPAHAPCGPVSAEPDLTGEVDLAGYFEAVGEPGEEFVTETSAVSEPEALTVPEPVDSPPHEAWSEWRSTDSGIDEAIEPDSVSIALPDLDRDVLGETPDVARDLDPAETSQDATTIPAAEGSAAERFSPDAPETWSDLETGDWSEQTASSQADSLLDELANRTSEQADPGALPDPVEAFAAIADVAVDAELDHGDAKAEVESEAFQEGTPDEQVADQIAPTNDDVDPDSLVLVVVRGVPDDARLSSGLRDDDGSWSLNPSELASVTISLKDEGQERLLGVDGTLSITGIALDERGALKAVNEIVPLEDYLAEPAPKLGAASPSSAGEIDVPADGTQARPETRIDAPAKVALEIDRALLVDGQFDALVIRDLPAGARLSTGAYDASIDGWVLMPQAMEDLAVILPPQSARVPFTATLLGVSLRAGSDGARVLTKLPVDPS
ncbi:MAG: hypothetical protein AAF637_13100 [Pseudomonadota bacterium]